MSPVARSRWTGACGRGDCVKLANADWPTFGWIDDVRPILRDAIADRRDVVLATLIRLEGAAPRPVGTQMVFDGATAAGYFSGGCLESDVANHAAAVLDDGAPRHLVYGRGSPWIDVRLSCGGRIELLLERLAGQDRAVVRMLDLSEQRRPAYWWSDGIERIAAAQPFSAPLAADNRPSYSLAYQPRWRIIVIGADPIALAIAQAGALAGFETILLRNDHARGVSPLTSVACLYGSATAILSSLGVDPWTAVVSATHDDEQDDQSMICALTEGAGYAGVLGATRKVADRKLRLSRVGLSEACIGSMRAPIGLSGCGKAPWEVAVSILAEVMQVRAAGDRSHVQAANKAASTSLRSDCSR